MLFDAEIDHKSIIPDLGETQNRCQNDPGALRRHPRTPKELRGTIWSVSGAPQERPKSLPGTTRECPRANRTPKRLSKSAMTRAEATKIDGKSALGALTSSKFVWVARKTLKARCHVDFRQVSLIRRTSFRTAPVGKNKDSAHRAGHRRAATKNLDNRFKFH